MGMRSRALARGRYDYGVKPMSSFFFRLGLICIHLCHVLLLMILHPGFPMEVTTSHSSTRRNMNHPALLHKCRRMRPHGCNVVSRPRLPRKVFPKLCVQVQEAKNSRPINYTRLLEHMSWIDIRRTSNTAIHGVRDFEMGAHVDACSVAKSHSVNEKLDVLEANC